MFFVPKLSFANVYVILMLVSFVNCEQNSLGCENRNDCDSCLKKPECAWCSIPKPKTKNDGTGWSHCFPQSKSNEECAPEDLFTSRSFVEVTEDIPLKNKNGFEVNLRPQKIRLNLKIGESYDLNFQYSHQTQHPVDVYYILDNSMSMKDQKTQLAESGDTLVQRMKNITNDLRIGFGSFVDKVEKPFVSTDPSRLRHPCVGCIAAYSFRNHLPLTEDNLKFAEEVTKTKTSGNLDSPEGGLDALMQAIVCREEIGWRPEAKHIILFSTDASFHIAGDGKLAGVIEPNDAKCHMKNGYYDGLDNDYPSVSQLNYVAKEHNIFINFLIANTTDENYKTYKLLSGEIDRSKTISLESIGMVVDIFEELVKTVTIESDDIENVEVKITPHCSYPIESGCRNLYQGEVVKFTASIKLLKCPDELKEPIIISLRPSAIQGSLKIKLVPICKCEK